jgi:hypothetical protein
MFVDYTVAPGQRQQPIHRRLAENRRDLPSALIA